jgi:hypothetical protein
MPSMNTDKRKNEFVYMPANDDRPKANGAAIVKVVVLALLFVLIGGKFGMPVSLVNFLVCLLPASLAWFLWRGLRRYLSSRR